MTKEDAESIIAKLAEHTAKSLYLERRIKELQVELATEHATIGRMKDSVSSAYAYLKEL